ncbi:MAG: hypothetical protein JO056_03110 [Alphaproteobacteria bacterium]|jgi:hypothetical protein|nr:hypothetical protein [Alphaproteobacteria bacterium]
MSDTDTRDSIAHWVAHKLFPENGGVDEDRNISGNAQAYARTLAVEINFLAAQAADTHNLTWKNVTPKDIEPLETVRELIALIVDHLS